MPKRYKKPKTFTKELLNAAVDHVINQKFTTRHVAQSFNIPLTTLQRHVQLAKQRGLPALQLPAKGTLQEIVMSLCITFYWVTASKLKQLMFEYEMAKLTDFQTFVSSHTCFARFICHQYFYNRTLQGVTTNYTLSETKAFFDDYEVEIRKLNIVPRNIYDVVEICMGVTKITSKSIICVNGKNYYVDENAPQLIVINSANAEGRYVPPFFVAQKGEIRKFIKDLEPDMVACGTSSNRLTAEIFIEWLHHFKDFAKPSALKPVLLIVDNSMWHVSISAYRYCQKHFIKLHVLPPHTAKRMHPLEQSLNKVLRKACQEEATRYLLNNPDNNIAIRDYVQFYITSFNGANDAYHCAKGFVSCGIYPPNPMTFRMTFNQDTKPLDETDPQEENLLNTHETQAGVLKFDYEKCDMQEKGSAVFVKPDYIYYSSSTNKNVATTISQLLLSTTRGFPVSNFLNQTVPTPVNTKKLPVIISKYIKNTESAKSKSADNVNQKISSVPVVQKISTVHDHSDALSHNLKTSGHCRFKIVQKPNEAYSKPYSATSTQRKTRCRNDNALSEKTTDTIQTMSAKEVQTDLIQFQISVLPSISIYPDIVANTLESKDIPNEFDEVLNIKEEPNSEINLHEEIDLPVDIIKTEEEDQELQVT